MATAASAAAMAIINMLKNNPSSLWGHKYLLKAMKFRFTLFSISSILISMVMRFLLVRKPNTPIKNSAVLINNKWYKPGSIIIKISKTYLNTGQRSKNTNSELCGKIIIRYPFIIIRYSLQLIYFAWQSQYNPLMQPTIKYSQLQTVMHSLLRL